MRTVNIDELEAQLFRLLEEAGRGEEIIIAKDGQPYVRLVPCLPEKTPRVLGGWEGRVRIAPDFDEAPDEVIATFEGRG